MRMVTLAMSFGGRIWGALIPPVSHKFTQWMITWQRWVRACIILPHLTHTDTHLLCVLRVRVECMGHTAWALEGRQGRSQGPEFMYIVFVRPKPNPKLVVSTSGSEPLSKGVTRSSLTQGSIVRKSEPHPAGFLPLRYLISFPICNFAFCEISGWKWVSRFPLFPSMKIEFKIKLSSNKEGEIIKVWTQI